ncbi:hypothetical protein ACLMJK_006755 [Lecanora helva]
MIEENGDLWTNGKNCKADLEDDREDDDGIEVNSALSKKRARRSVLSRKAKYNIRGKAVKYVLSDDDEDGDYGLDGDEQDDWDEERDEGKCGSGEEGGEEDEDDENEGKDKNDDGNGEKVKRKTRRKTTSETKTSANCVRLMGNDKSVMRAALLSY